MMPIVNGLEAEFGDSVQFVYLNAEDGADGQRAFTALSLPGHPSYLVFAADGSEIYRTFGVVEADMLRTAITSSLNSSMGTSTP